MKQMHRSCCSSRAPWALAVVGVLASAILAQAQDVRIRFRPLTPQEIKNAGLPNTTQKSGGAPNAGIGQPVYMEALVSTQTTVTGVGFTNRFATALTSINWNVVGLPPGSAAIMSASPLSNEVPTYDGGDRAGYFVAGRAVLKPDVVCQVVINPPNTTILDYKVETVLGFTNKTVFATNSAYGSTYLGQSHYLCALCHADKTNAYAQTDHATAFKRAITGESTDHFNQNCISCHSLGYDTTAGATNGGFDDIAAQIGWTFPATFSPTNWSEMNTNLQAKANVQCENCHGPASTHMISGGITNAIDVTLSAGTCGQCHDSLTHHVKNYEWGQSMHATGYVFRFSGSCQPCHSSKGFIETWDPYYVATNKVPRGTEQEGIACAACHDPHTVGMGEHQLRNIPQATLSNGVVVTSAIAGTGVLCMNCHHARANNGVVVSNLASSSISPHHSTQADLLLGENGHEYGLDLPSSRHLLAVSNSCLGCHKQMLEGTQWTNELTHVGGHTFRVSWDSGTVDTNDDVHVTEVCSVCHVEEGTFNFGGEDYDRDGTVEGIQSEVDGLLEQLANLLPPAGPAVTVTTGYTLSQRKAAWNYFYILEDQSRGVHNPKYATALLQLSLDDLTGGIDIDNDGLADTWEMAQFGSLTAQLGTGDADGDGLSNEMEEQLGTNPNLADSDNDGISDLAEVQGGSNPLNIASVLSTNLITMQGAIELAYLPEMAGQTQRFESVSMFGDGAGWTNAGPSFISSNSWSYQLISLRDATQRYFRVVKP